MIECQMEHVAQTLRGFILDFLGLRHELQAVCWRTLRIQTDRLCLCEDEVEKCGSAISVDANVKVNVFDFYGPFIF